MKLNDTILKLNFPGNRCCLNTFANKFAEPEQPEDVVDLIESQAEYNPDVAVGDSFTCAHCGNIILLTEAGTWESVNPADVETVIDLSNPAPAVAAEPLTTPEVVV